MKKALGFFSMVALFAFGLVLSTPVTIVATERGIPRFTHVATGTNLHPICDPQSANFYPRQETIAWKPVDRSRIEEADYYERTFEASIRIGAEERFAYKVLMNIRGKPVFVFVALLDHRKQTIDVKELASAARMILQGEAMTIARQNKLGEALLALTNNKNDILLWSHQSNAYFTVDTLERFAVFELSETGVSYVCAHQSDSTTGR